MLQPATAEHVMLALDRRARFFTDHPKLGRLDRDTPQTLASLLLSTGDLRRILRVVRSPTLRPDGSLIDRPGFDRPTGLYYAPNATYPGIPARPTRDDARAALVRLLRPFRGFPLAEPRDAAVVVAEILTTQNRHLAPRAPGFLHRAPEAGSGKTLLAELCCLIGAGTEAPNFSGAIFADEAELKKVLTTLTLTAAPFALFDNVERGAAVDCGPLNQFVTAVTYSDRLLGGNAQLEALTATVVVITGNGIGTKGDASRRFLIVDLDAGEERPELRRFDFDAMAEVQADRVELVVAALTLVVAYIRAGRPWTLERGVLGSFEEWDRLVSGAIVWAGGGDPVATLDKARENDPEREKLQALLHHLRRTFHDTPFKAGQPVAEASGDDALRAAMLEVALSAAGKLEPKMLGEYLKRNDGRTTGGLRLAAKWNSDAKTFRYQLLEYGGDPRDLRGCYGGEAGATPVQKSQGRQDIGDDHGGVRGSFLNPEQPSYAHAGERTRERGSPIEIPPYTPADPRKADLEPDEVGRAHAALAPADDEAELTVRGESLP